MLVAVGFVRRVGFVDLHFLNSRRGLSKTGYSLNLYAKNSVALLLDVGFGSHFMTNQLWNKR